MKASVYLWRKPGDYELAAEAEGKVVHLELNGKPGIPPCEGDAALSFAPGAVERIVVGSFGDVDIYCGRAARFHVYSHGVRYACRPAGVPACK